MAKHYNYDALSGRYISPTSPNKANPFIAQTQQDSKNLMPRSDSSKNLISDTTTSDDELDETLDPFNTSDIDTQNVVPNDFTPLNPSDDSESDEEDLSKGYHSDNDSLSSLTASLPRNMRKSGSNRFLSLTASPQLSKSLPGDNSLDEYFKEHQMSQIKRQISPPTVQTPSDDALSQNNILVLSPNTATTSITDPNLQKNNEKTYWRWFWSRPGGSNPTPATTEALVSPSTLIANEVKEVEKQPQVFDPTGEFRVLKKSLRPTSDELKSLGLKDGKNEVKFLVTSRILGTQEVAAYIYFWKHSDKIVVSDVDGTITKSDALGHILPMLGQDWSHSGIGKLYTKIVENGYRMLYLTSRSIIQSGATKRYIFTLQQEDAMLPEGPVVMSPDRLFAALHREVILKRPEEFKKAALGDVLELFPKNSDPFFAGFGNRVNDIISYSFVNIPNHKIFTVDPTGLIQVYGVSHESYWNVFKLVDEIFPNLKEARVSPSDYNSFSFWRAPIPSVADFNK